MALPDNKTRLSSPGQKVIIILCVHSLPARTSIIAAANPVAGHYNKAKTVSENLR